MQSDQVFVGLTAGRAAALEALREQPDPVSLEALSAATGKHPNTLREQLAWLTERGLVQRVKQPSVGRGRPAWLYQARGPRPGKDDYAELAASLAWTLQDSSEDTQEQALAAGRHWGRHLVAERGAVAEPSEAAGRRRTVELMEELGYQPTPDENDDLVVLHHCPLLEATHRFPDVVCTLHLGLVQQALAENGADPDRATLTPFAAPAECHLRLLA